MDPGPNVLCTIGEIVASVDDLTVGYDKCDWTVAYCLFDGVRGHFMFACMP